MEKKVKIRQIETTNKVAFLKMRHHALRTACIKTSSGVVICVFRSSHLILVLLLILLSLRDPDASVRPRSALLRVKVLYLNRGRRHSETEVLVGGNVRYVHGFVLDVAGRHRFVLVQLKWAGHVF